MSGKARDAITRGRRDGYVPLLSLLLLTAAVASALRGGDGGCTGSVLIPVTGSPGGGIIPGPQPEITGLISGTASPVAGRQRVNRVLSMTPTSGPPVTVEVRYTPPFAAWGFSFDGPKPRNPDGPPPYVFEQILVGFPETTLPVSYVAPEPWNDLPSVNGEDTFLVKTSAGNEYAWVKPLVSLKPGSAAAAEAAASNGDGGRRFGPDAFAPAESASSAYSWWVSHFWFGLGAGKQALTSDLCQNTVNYLRSGSFFVAIRFPNAAGETDSSPVSIPFRYSEPGRYPRMDILNETVYPARPVVSLPLAVAPEWRSVVLNRLPQAAGEHWVALAPSSTGQATCPSSLNLSTWEFYSFVPIDAGPSVLIWNEKLLPGYFCFATDNPPTFLSLLGQNAGLAEMADGVAPDVPVTALGPFPIRLFGGAPDPPYFISGPQLAWAQPSGTVQLRFLVENRGSAPVTLSLNATSTLPLPWRICGGSYDSPDVASPITAPFEIAKTTTRPVWLVADVPSGAAGGETVILTASSTSPARSVWNSGLVWVGSLPNVRRIRRHLNPRGIP